MQDILLCGWRGQLLREVNKAYKADGMQSTPILVDLRHLPPKKKIVTLKLKQMSLAATKHLCSKTNYFLQSKMCNTYLCALPLKISCLTMNATSCASPIGNRAYLIVILL